MAGWLLAQQPQQAPRQAKTQEEYNLLTAVNQEQDWKKKLPILLEWKSKYPDSAFKVDRQQVLVNTYQQLGRPDDLWTAAGELVDLSPSDVTGLFFLTTFAAGSTDEAKLARGEKAAPALLKVAAGNKALEGPAHKTLGWIAYSRKRHAEAETALTESLRLTPESGLASYWLGSALLAQKSVEKQTLAFHHLARAARYSGPDALAPTARQQLEAFVKKTYVSYHGSESGLDELYRDAAARVFPADGFTILSAGQVKEAEMEKLRESDPNRYAWLRAKELLQAPGGVSYFDMEMKDSALPKLKGKVISASPEGRPRDILVAIVSDGIAEIRLQLDLPMPVKAQPGTEIEFEGAVAKAYSSEPFLLTASIERAKIVGWPKR